MLKTKYIKKAIIPLLCLLLMLNISSCSEKTGNGDNTGKSASGKDAIELVNDVNELTIKEGNPLQSEKVIEACAVLEEQAGELTDQDVLDIVKNDKMTSITKTTVVQLSNKINQGNGISDQTPFEELISQRSLDTDTRVALIHTLDVSSEKNKKVLENIIKSEEGAVVVRSLLTLEKVDPLNALRIANEIINNDAKYNDDAIRAAVMVKADYFQDLRLADSKKDVSEEKRQFIDFCILNFEASQDNIFKDVMTFALMDILDYSAMKLVVLHDGIDKELKLACVNRNYKTLVEVLSQSPTKEDIEFITIALEIAPIRDLYDLMQETLKKHPEYKSDRLDHVLVMMKTRDFYADKKLLEKKPDSRWLT